MKPPVRWVVSIIGGALLAGCSGDDGKPSGPLPTLTVDAAASDAGGASDAPADAAKRALAEDCRGDADCESGICFLGGKSAWCSAKCTPANAAQVCTGIFAGDCNQQGFCRRPN